MEKLNIPNVEAIQTTVTKIKNGELKVYDLVKAHLDLAHEINPTINAFITILDSALENAKEMDEKISKGQMQDKRLLGIPFTVKDLYLVKNTKTTFSSKFMEDFVAPYTATIVKKIEDEGGILIGKTNSDPWGLGSTGENSGYGPVKHPQDLTRSPGGSSSGSAASLLAGVGFFSLATDTGGSVRQPASLTGLYGLKPTYGRNSRFGIGSMASSFDTPGFFARNLEDIELVESIIEGKDPNDPTTRETPKNSQLETKNYKLGLPKEFFNDLSGEIKDSIMKKIEEFKAEGHEIVEISIPSLKYGLAAYYILVPSEISSNRARYDGVRFGPKVTEDYYENLIKSRGQFFEDEVKRRIMVGTFALSAGYADQFYKKASKVRSKLKKEFDEAFKQVDLIISPVSPITAPKLGENMNDPVKMYLLDIYTVTANLVGVPALAVPTGSSSEGLPIGLQVIANMFEEEKIFRFLDR